MDVYPELGFYLANPVIPFLFTLDIKISNLNGCNLRPFKVYKGAG